MGIATNSQVLQFSFAVKCVNLIGADMIFFDFATGVLLISSTINFVADVSVFISLYLVVKKFM